MTSLQQEARIALVVEDDPTLLQLLAEVLGEAGFAVTCCGDGQSAMEALAQCNFDLLVIDLGLPDMNGTRICMEARERYGNDIAILIVTGDRRKERHIAALELGADDVVGKPFAPEELVARATLRLRRTAGSSDRSNA